LTTGISDQDEFVEDGGKGGLDDGDVLNGGEGALDVEDTLDDYDPSLLADFLSLGDVDRDDDSSEATADDINTSVEIVWKTPVSEF